MPREGLLTGDAVRDAAHYAVDWLRLQAEEQRIPGVQVAVAFGGKVVMSSAFGVADVESNRAMSANSLVRIGSLSKTVTAMAVMRLAQDGALTLDDSIGDHVEGLPPAVAGITIVELLSHTGGILRDCVDAGYWAGARNFPDASELADLLGDEPAVFRAGERFKYSNFGYALLGRAVERCSGRSFAAFVSERILEPLGMENTGTRRSEAGPQHEFAAGYACPDPRAPLQKINPTEAGALAPATGFYSTAADLCRLADAFRPANTLVLDQQSQRRMQEPVADIGGRSGHYALGLHIADVEGRALVGHTGDVRGAAATLRFDRDADLAVSVVCNASGAPILSWASTVVRLIDFAGKQQPGAPAEVEARRFTGRYRNDFGPVDVALFKDRLYYLKPRQPDPLNGAVPLEVLDANRVRIGGEGFGPIGEVMTFHFDGDRVSRISGPISLAPESTYRRRREAATTQTAGSPHVPRHPGDRLGARSTKPPATPPPTP